MTFPALLDVVVEPFAFTVFGKELTGFGLAVLLAFVIAQIISERETARRGHDPSPIGDLVIAAILGTVLGAKLYYVLVISHDWRDLFSRGGFVFWGGFMGAVALCWVVAKWRKVGFVRTSDVAGIAIAAGYAVGRTGCWAVGDDYGRPWSGPLAVMFPNGAPPSTAGTMAQVFGTPIPAGVLPTDVLAVHPTQLYETVMGFVMFAILWRLRDHEHAEGWLFGVYLVLAGLERFIVEFWRAKDDRFFGVLTMAQVISLGLCVLGFIWMNARRVPGAGKPGIHARDAVAA